MPFVAGTFVPPDGIAIGRLAPISFYLLEDSSLIYASFGDGSRELVWDGAAFQGPYARSSAMEFRVDQFFVALRRVGGWPSSQVRIDLEEDA